MAHRPGVPVRSYRGVVDEVERRIYRIDRWRLPTPHGVSVRAIAYGLGSLATIMVAASLPLLGAVVGAIPASVRLVAVPLLGGWALASWRLDGRAPHRALASALRYTIGPRTLAGLRRCPPVGSQMAVVDAVQVAPSGDEPRLRRGRVRGPALVALRYPSRVELDGVPRGSDSDPRSRLAAAERVRLVPLHGHGRPLTRAATIRVPDGKEVLVG